MKMALDSASGVNVIRSYERGSVQIRDRSFSNSLVVLPDEVIVDWPPETPGDLNATHFRPIAERAPEVLLLGTGETQSFPDPRVFLTLMDLGIGFEVMDNAAACRTYNILLSEGRRAAVALILPGVPQ